MDAAGSTPTKPAVSDLLWFAIEGHTDAPNMLVDAVYRTLWTQIVEGDRQQGERLSDVDLAAELGVSRTPIRQALHQLQRPLPVSDLIRDEPFIQTVGNDFTGKHIAAVEVGGKGELRCPAFSELALEEPDIGLVRTGRQRDRFLVALDGNGRVAGCGKPPPDVCKGLAQAVSRLRIASSRPKPFAKPFARVASATRQNQGGKKQRGLARCEADRLTLCGSHFETAKQPDAHAAPPNSERADRIASSPVDLTRI